MNKDRLCEEKKTRKGNVPAETYVKIEEHMNLQKALDREHVLLFEDLIRVFSKRKA